MRFAVYCFTFKLQTMITADLKSLELMEFQALRDPAQRCKANFPLLGAHGTKTTATVYFELEPGDNLGRHTDSAEELLLVLEGTVEAEVGGKRAEMTVGGIAVVPKLVPHDIRNTGKGKARVIGFFGGANNIVATFEKGWSNPGVEIVDTAAMSNAEIE